MIERDHLEFLYYKYVNKKSDIEATIAKLITELGTVKTVIDDLEHALEQTGHVLVREHWADKTSCPENEE